MNQQQLETARLLRWSHNGNARPTQEDAQAWLETIGFCPLAPLVLPGNPPVPTLLEAFVGKPLAQPTLDERASLHSLLARLVRAKIAVPLLLISPAGEQPDFVATLEALPFLYAMRGDRDWRGQPAATGQGRVSQLALHCWQELDRNGAQTLDQLQRALGGELTQAAVLRALCELWGHLRVYPQLQIDDAGQSAPPVWELLSRTYGKQVSIGAGLSQSAAMSGILSMYLSAVFAASDAEIVAFFSPLASQSKTREMVHGLTATRQLGRIPYEGGMLLHLKDGLPPELLIDLHVPEAPEGESGFSGRPARSFGRDSERAPIRKWEPRARPASDSASRPVRMAAEGAPAFERAPRRDSDNAGREQARPPRRDFAEKKFEGKKFEGKKFGGKKFDGPKFEKPKFDKPRFDGPKFDAARPAWKRAESSSNSQRPASDRPLKKPFSKPFEKSFDKSKPFDKSKSFSKPFAKPFVKKESFGDAPDRSFKKPFVKKNWEARSAPRRDADSSARPQDRERSNTRPAARTEWKKPQSADVKPSEGRDFRAAKPAFKKTGTGKPAFSKSKPAGRSTPAGKSGAAKFGAGKPAAKRYTRDSKSEKPFKRAGSSEKSEAKPAAHGPARKEPFWMKPMHPKRKKRDD